MLREGGTKPIQEDLFPETAKAKAESHIEQVVAVDRNRPSAVIMVEGYELTFVVYKGKIELAAMQGATSRDEIPPIFFAAAKRRATAILREIEAEGSQQKPRTSETQK